MRAVPGQPAEIANSQDSSTSDCGHRHPAWQPIFRCEPGESSSRPAPPLAAGGIAAGAKNRNLGLLRSRSLRFRLIELLLNSDIKHKFLLRLLAVPLPDLGAETPSR